MFILGTLPSSNKVYELLIDVFYYIIKSKLMDDKLVARVIIHYITL